MPHYGNVPFEVPSGWVWTTLEETLELVSGQDFPPEKYNVNIAGIPYIIGASNIENEQLVINRWTEFPSVYSHLNDLLVVCKGAGVGKMAINNIGTVHIARQIQAVRSYTNCTNIRYIKNVVKNDIESIVSKANGLIPGLKRELLLSLQIPLPPLAEQQRIVTEIDKWFAIIDQIERDKVDLQATIKQVKSKILDLAIHGKLVPQDPNDEPAIELLKRINPDFTPCDNGHSRKFPQSWCSVTVNDVCSIIGGVSYNKADIQDTGIRVLRGGNIQNGKVIDCFDDVFIPLSYQNNDNQVQHGDIIVVASTGSQTLIGKTGFADRDIPKTQIGAFLRIVRPKQKALSPYIRLIFQTDDYKGYIRNVAKGSNINNVKNAHLQNYQIYLPPLEEQQRIVQKIEALFSVLDNIQNALEV
mgnify:CR=1 FL=1